ncbi:MAG: hypothetical protein AAF458_10945 [Pseudomonadota bacterium]
MARLSQIQLTFVPADDRLLLRISTDEKAELRFWLTRRFVRLLLPVLAGMSLHAATSATVQSAEARAAIADFQRDHALANADFETQFQDDATIFPLGENPVLLERIQTRSNDVGAPVLCLHPANGSGIDLALETQLLHSFKSLLSDAIGKADWNLDTSALHPVATSTPSVLN